MDRKRGVSTTWANRALGSPAVRRVWPSGPTARRTGSQRTREGSRATPTASGSCRSMPRLPCARSIRSAYSTTRRTRSANGAGARASADCSAADSSLTWRVASSGTRSSRTPASRTRASASGSTCALNSASGVTLPGTSTAPPIATTWPALRIAAASRSTASARLVRGPRATIVRPPPYRVAASTITPGASTEATRGSTGGQSGKSPSPSPPWYAAVRSGRASGRAAPVATSGAGNGRRRSSSRKTLRAQASSGALPATTVTTSTVHSGEPQASSSASASSMPGSVSMRARRLESVVTGWASYTMSASPSGKGETGWTSRSSIAASETTCLRPPVCRPPSRTSTASPPRCARVRVASSKSSSARRSCTRIRRRIASPRTRRSSRRSRPLRKRSRRTLQLLPKPRVGYGDQRRGPLPLSASLQLRRAVLGHYPVREESRRRHGRPGRQPRHDPRDAPLASGGGQRDDRGAAARAAGAEDEIELAADARHLPAAEALRRHLTREVDLERRVDRDEPIETRDDVRIVHELGGLHVDAVVVTDEVEQPARPHGLRDVHAPAVQALGRARHHAALDEADGGVDEQRVQREVAVALQRLEHRLGNGPDADLDGRAVGHQRRHVPADGALDLADDGRRILDEGLVDVDPGVDLATVQPAVTPRAGHAGIHLRDHQRRRARGRQRHADGHAEREVARRVGGRRVHEHAVGRPVAAAREPGDEADVSHGH